MCWILDYLNFIIELFFIVSESLLIFYSILTQISKLLVYSPTLLHFQHGYSLSRSDTLWLTPTNSSTFPPKSPFIFCSGYRRICSEYMCRSCDEVICFRLQGLLCGLDGIEGKYCVALLEERAYGCRFCGIYLSFFLAGFGGFLFCFNSEYCPILMKFDSS